MNDETIIHLLMYLQNMIDSGQHKLFYNDLMHDEKVIDIINAITNLQKENEKLKEEIERLRNEIKKISEQHIYTLDKLIETQTRIEKTIEYIKENGYIDLNGYDLLKILGGDEE